MTKKFWITALAFGVPWAIFMIIYFTIIGEPIQDPIVSILIVGLAAGILFSWIMQFAAKRLFKKIIVETASNEKIIKEGGANHFMGKEAVGGKLVLTDKRLIFKSHKFNIQNHQENFELEQIEKVAATSPFKLFKNGITLELVNNVKHKFIVDEPTDWIGEIENQKQPAQ